MIKNVSSTFKANCKKDSVKYREYIVIDNKEVDIKGNLSDTAYKDTTFFGKFNLKMLKFETENDIDYKKKEFTYYKEVDGESLKIGTFIVTDVSDSDTYESVNVTAYDYGLKFANPYTTTLNYLEGNVTLFQVVQEICNNCDIELENTYLPNGSFIVDSNQFVNGEKYGDVICIVALENGMFATINSNNKLEFIFTNETDEIIEDYVELDDKRDTQPITSVLVAPSKDLETAGAVMKDQTLINQYGEHWLKIYDSYFANSTTKCQQLIGAIFNQVKGFGYSSFKSEYSFLPYLSLGDKIKFKNKEGKLVDSIILRYETNYDEMILEAPSIINASIEYELPETPEETSKKALVKVDQANGEIELIAKDIGELNYKTAQLRLDVDKIEGEITEIADITTTSEGVGTISVLKVAKDSEPIYLKVRPTTKNLALLYPADNLYPSDDLYPLERYLLFKNGSYEQRYRLPADLWYYNSTTYDEFVLDYDNNRCYVIHRVGVNADGTTYILDSVTEEDFTYPNIPLTEGDYQISLEGHETAYIYARLMAQNIYTDQFVTQVEYKAQVNVTSKEISTIVKEKVGKTEVISSINQSAETVKVKANKIEIDGVMTAINNNTTTTINGDKITTGSITANQIKSGTITADKVSSDVITTNNFSAQNINADKITTGTLSTARLNTDVITTSNFSAQNINANQITSGSLSANRVSGGTLTGSNIDVYSGTGFLRYMTSQSIHPFVSALNMAYGAGNGLSFRSSTTRTNLGSALGHLSVGDAQLLLEAYSGSGRNMYVAGPSISLVTNSGTRNNTGDYAGSIYVYASESVTLNARNGAVYAGNGTSGSNSRVAVDSSGPSSRNLKENITDFEDYDSALRLLKNMKIYNYNYKYKLSDKKDQYGFIIDDLLEDKDAQKFLYFKDDKAIPNEEGYFDYQRADEDPDNENIINFKRYDEEMLVKYLLITNKALLKKIEELEEKINGKN